MDTIKQIVYVTDLPTTIPLNLGFIYIAPSPIMVSR